MKNLSSLLAPAILGVVSLALGFQFLTVYKTYVRNQAIDGCYTQSFYQAEEKDGNKTVTTRETQKYIYDQCLADKGVVLEPR